jgi:hypothetical protein
VRTIKGRIVFPADAPVAKDQVAEIEVLDISLADAPSRVLARHVLWDVEVAPKRTLAFTLEAPESDPGAQLTLRAHVHPSREQRILAGDMLSTVACPVPPEGTPEPIDVPVQVISSRRRHPSGVAQPDDKTPSAVAAQPEGCAPCASTPGASRMAGAFPEARMGTPRHAWAAP